MSDILEITELDFNNDFDSGFNKSTNFGGGLELLMNDKIKESGKPTSDIDLEDLNNLENELNNLVDDIPSNSYAPKSDFFNKPSVSFNDSSSSSVKFGETNIGQGTAETENDAKTWDGYGKFNNIPMNPDKNISMEPKLSKQTY